MIARMQFNAAVSTATFVLALAACGGSGGDSDVAAGNGTESRPSVAGIWAGTVTPTGAGSSNSVVSIVMDDGASMTRLNLWRTGATLTALPFMMKGTLCCNETVDSIVEAAGPLPNTSGYIPQVHVGGAVTTDTFTGTIQSVPALSSPHSFSLTRNTALYERGLTLGALSGNYSVTVPFTTSGGVINHVITLNVNGSGAVAGSVSLSTCMIDGLFSIPNTRRNLFRIQNFNVFNCSSAPVFHSSFNRTYEGLGYLTDDPARPGTTNNLLVIFAASGGGFFPVISLQK